MAAFSAAKIKQFLKDADAATTSAAKGKIFEDLVCYLFEKVPGLILPQRDVLNTFESEEIDVAFYNEQDPKGLKAFNAFLLIECKNWSGAPRWALSSRSCATAASTSASLSPPAA